MDYRSRYSARCDSDLPVRSEYFLHAAAALLATTALTWPVHAQELPSGGSVAAGSAVIAAPAGGALAVNQASDRAVINWQSFSIGSGGMVTFNQPGPDSVALNRVTGPLPSTIDGTLRGNGQIFVANPSGVIVGAGGRVEAQGFVASSLDIADHDFMAGNLTFSGDGASALVANHGSIEIGRGGYAALLGGVVANSGTINVPLGRVGFGAGELVTLDLSGDQFLQVAVPSGNLGDDVLIENTGTVSADGGRIEMRAATAREAARRAVNLSGVVEARSVSGRSGSVTLGGGAGGTVQVSGRISVAAPERSPLPAPRPEVGAITITGRDIALQGADVDASGAGGGGTILVGGNLQGQGPIANAEITTADATTRIVSDATEDGDGGTIVLWADGFTDFEGTISSRGSGAGAGGFAEVSGLAQLSFGGVVDLTAESGETGTLLLDPFDIEITATESSGITSVPITDARIFNGAAVPSQLFVGDLTGALGTADVIVDTSGAGDQPGDITVSAPITWSANTELNLRADNDIVVNQAITGNGALGSLRLEADGGIFANAALSANGPSGSIDILAPQVNLDGAVTSGGNIRISAPVTPIVILAPQVDLNETITSGVTQGTILAIDAPISSPSATLVLDNVAAATGPNGAINVAVFEMNNSSIWTQNAASDGFALPNFNATDFRISSGQFIRVLGGNGSASTPYFLTDVFGLQGANLGTTDGVGILNYSLSNDINASGTSAWNAGGGFVGIAGNEGGVFGGTFEGNGFTISGLTINNNDVRSGMFATIGSTGVVRNLRLSGANIDGSPEFGPGGALAGSNQGAIQNVLVTGSDVRMAASGGEGSPFDFGGLVGRNSGTIQFSAFEGNLSVADSGFSGTVSLGGLVGRNTGQIEDSYVRASIIDSSGTSPLFTGGLVGTNDNADIGRSYAVTDALPGTAGGLVGRNFGDGRISASFWDSTTSGIFGPGPGVPLSTDLFQDTEQFFGSGLFASGSWDPLTTWAPGDAGHYPALYVLSPVILAQASPFSGTYGDPVTITGTIVGNPGNYVFTQNTGDSIDPANVFVAPGFTGNAGNFSIGTVANVLSAQGDSFRVVGWDASLDIAQRPVVIQPLDGSKTYGELGDLSFFTSNLVPGDTANVTLDSGGAPIAANVGTYDVLVDAVTIFNDGVDVTSNYVQDRQQGEFTVNQAPLVLTPNDVVKPFGFDFVLDPAAVTAIGLLPGQTVEVASLSSPGAPASAPIEGSPYPIEIEPLDTFNPTPVLILDASDTNVTPNYVISFQTGALNIVPTLALEPTMESNQPTPSTQVGPASQISRFPQGLPNPVDTIVGDTSGSASGETQANQSEIAEAGETLAVVGSLSESLETTAEVCRQEESGAVEFLGCLVDALDDYAAAIGALTSDLPPELQSVAGIIVDLRNNIDNARATAEIQLRSAATDAERAAISRNAIEAARSAVQSAAQEIQQAIGLIRVDDPELASIQIETGGIIVDALFLLDTELARATEL